MVQDRLAAHRLPNGVAPTPFTWGLLGGQVDAAWWTFEWNPIIGCTPVSTGCLGCPNVTDTLTKTIKVLSVRSVQVLAEEFKPSSELYSRSGFPDIVKVCDCSDLFHEAVPFVALLGVLTAVYRMPHKLFFVRTKRPDTVHKLLSTLSKELSFVAHLSNLWIGTSVEDKFVFPTRVASLLKLPKAVNVWLSYEPAISSIPTTQWEEALRHGRITWVTSGGEVCTRSSRPADPQWFKEVLSHCQKYKVPLWHIGNGCWLKAHRPSIDAFGDVGSGYHIDYTIDGEGRREFPVTIEQYLAIVNHRIANVASAPPNVRDLPLKLRTCLLRDVLPKVKKVRG